MTQNDAFNLLLHGELNRTVGQVLADYHLLCKRESEPHQDCTDMVFSVLYELGSNKQLNASLQAA